MRNIIKCIAAVIIGSVMFFTLGWMAMNGMVRESQARDEIRKERCARMGEKMPKQLEHYCSDLGV